MSKLLSIIVPAYNAGEFIGELLKGLVPQMNTFKDEVELVLIDDGSTDDTTQKMTTCIAGLKADSIYRGTSKNHGIGWARKTGLDCARGKYITFIDADDLVSRLFVNALMKVIKEEKEYDKVDFLSKDEMFDALCNPSVVWGHMYRKQFLIDHNIDFDEKDRIFEDVHFQNYFANGKFNARTKALDKVLYVHRTNRNPNSLLKRHQRGEKV